MRQIYEMKCINYTLQFPFLTLWLTQFIRKIRSAQNLIHIQKLWDSAKFLFPVLVLDYQN